MCFGGGKSSRRKSSDGDLQYAPRPARVPLSIERPIRVAVPVQARSPSPRQTSNIPLSILTPEAISERRVNTYKDPNPWPPEMVLEYDEYKAADRSAGRASTRYRQVRAQREAEVNALSWSSGRETFAPMNLTPESHFELRPMAVDWKHKARNHYQLRERFDNVHPTAYDSPEDKKKHQTYVRNAKRSANKAAIKAREHRRFQGNFLLSDPYDNYDLATGGRSNLPNGQRRKTWDYDN